uniref:Uncharacterized protein n=1 Tax=Pyrodinium bahamense TaxID=73915 RepID=A0A7S0AXV7_9DINO
MALFQEEFPLVLHDGQPVFVRNTFLCVNDSDDSDLEDTVRHTKSEPAGYRHAPTLRELAARSFSSAPADYSDASGPVTPQGFESTDAEESESPVVDTTPRRLRWVEQEQEEKSAPLVADTSPRRLRTLRVRQEQHQEQEAGAAAQGEQEAGPGPSNEATQAQGSEVQDAAAAEGVSAAAVQAPFPGAVPVAWTAPAQVVHFPGMVGLAPPLQPATLWQPLGHVAVATTATQVPDTQASDIAGAALGGLGDACQLATNALAQACVPRGPAPSASQAVSGHDRAHVFWTVNSRKIHSKETKVASPRFCVLLPCGPCPFQLMLYAEARSPRWGSSGFARARGRGRIELRCGAQPPSGSGGITFGLSLGDQPPRPPVSHDFSQQSCCGLRRWDFSSAVDPSTGTFVVHLEIVALGPFEGNLARRGGA